MRARPRSRRARFRRHGLIRPTLPAGALVVVGGALGYLGLLLDDRALMAAVTMLAVLLIVDLVFALTQRFVPAIRGANGSSIARWFAPRAPETTPQWEQVDEEGRPVARGAGPTPERRGVYWHISVVVRWRTPFRLFAVRWVRAADGETVRLPEPPDMRASRGQAPDRRMAGQSQSDNAGGVRDYAPGDPPRLIAWRHSARLGELMTRETDRDARPATLLVVDRAAAGGDSDCLDALIAAGMPYLLSASSAASERIAVIDGRGVREGLPVVRRYLAALQPTDGAGHDSGRSADGAVNVGTGRDTKHDADSDISRGASHEAGRGVWRTGRDVVRGADGGTDHAVDGVGASGVETGADNDAGRIVDEAVRYAARAHGPLRLVLLGSPRSGLAAAFAHSPLADRLTVVEAVTPCHVEAKAAVGMGQQQAKPRSRSAGAAIATRALSAAALLTFFGVALTALAGLVAPDGWWLWWFGSLLVLSALAAHIPARAIQWRILRPLCFAAAALAGALALVILRIHDITGLWLTGMPDATDMERLNVSDVAGFVSLSIDADTDAVHVCLASPGTGTGPAACSDNAWGLLSNVITRGFDALNLQLPPLKVDATADCFLIFALTLVAIVLRFLLVCRRAAVPTLALLPVAALAADYAFVGHTAPWWALAALACAFPISLWAAVSAKPPTSPSLAAPVALLASVLAAALTLALSPSALALAYRVPLSFGEGGGLLSTNTVNPMIDLKRDLVTGSSSTVLTYAADRRVYLRMSTLDDFDGETWNFDPTLARDGGFYGSGIQLGRNAEDEPTKRQRISSNPYAAYAYAERMEHYGSGDAWYAGLPSTGGLESFSVQTDVEIATLRSRFLPVPGEGAYVKGVSDDWLSYGDGSVYNRTHSTSASTWYTAYATYLDPISSDEGFEQIERIADAGKELLSKTNRAPRPDTSDAERSAVRRAFAADLANVGAGARLADGMLLVPVEFGTGSAISFAGQDIGQMRVTGSFTSSDGTLIPAGDFEFNDDFAETLLLGEKEAYAAAFGIPSVGGPESDGASEAMLAFVVYDDPIWTELNAENNDDQAGAGFAGTLVRHLSDVLGGDGTWVGFMSDTDDSGASSGSAVDIERVRAAVESANTTARRYRSLPKNLPANVRAVIDQAKAAGVSAKGNGRDQQVAAMRWLVDYFTDPANHFTYSLDAPDGDGRDNLTVIDDFLDPERGHAGYCAHYASALAVLGRALGVPTRLVLGYNKGSAPADSSGRYEVAARQLHSWVEAYIDGVGWMPFDVTPASVDNGSATATETGGDADDDDSPIVNGDTSDAEKEGVARVEGDDTADMTDDDAEDETVERADAAKGKGAADTGASASARLVWMWGALIGVALLLAVLALVPMLRRRLRRRARLAVIQRAIAEPDDAALADRAWLAAWAEIQDEAFRSGLIWPRRRSGADSGRDSGAGSGSGGQRGWCGWRLRRKLTWPSTATDLDIAELIAGRLETNAPLDAARVRAIARHAARAAFRPLHCSEDKPGLG